MTSVSDQFAFADEYAIHVDRHGLAFQDYPASIPQMDLHPNAVVYSEVPLLDESSHKIVDKMDVTIWEVDSSRDLVANYYGIMIQASKRMLTSTWEVYPYVKVGQDWILEPTSANGREDFLIVGFKAPSNHFSLHSQGWKTYRTSKNAALVEIVASGRQRRAVSPRLALPYYKLQRAFHLYKERHPADDARITYTGSLLAHLPRVTPALFGTSGVRGKLGRDMNEDIVLATSQAIIESLIAADAHGPIVVGGDTRFSSEDFARTAAEVFAAQVDTLSPDRRYPAVIFMDTPLLVTDPQASNEDYYRRDSGGQLIEMRKPYVPTPLMTFAIRSLNPRAVFGVTITASHNYGTDNGYKALRGVMGGIAQEETTTHLQRRANEILTSGMLVNRYDFDRAVADGIISRQDFRSAYFSHIESLLPKHSDSPSGFDVIRASQPRVAIDLLYGTGNGFLDTILEAISNGEWPIIARKFHYWRDPSFGGARPDCEDPDNVRDLITFVKSNPTAVDLGLSVDSDADRFGIVDAMVPAGLVNANYILAMQFYYRNQICGIKDPVCRTIVTSHMLDAMAKAYGAKLLAVPRIGPKWIGDRMNDEGLRFVVAGEEASGLTVGDFPDKDGILANILTLEMMCKLGQLEQDQRKRMRPVKPLSEILGHLQRQFGAWYYHRTDLYGIRDKQKVMDYFRFYFRPQTIGSLELEAASAVRNMYSFYDESDPRRATEENRAKARSSRDPLTNDNVIAAGDNPLVGDGVKFYLQLSAANIDEDPYGAPWRGDGIVGAWVHIRESGNEPVIRVYAQHRTSELALERIQNEIVEHIMRVDSL